MARSATVSLTEAWVSETETTRVSVGSDAERRSRHTLAPTLPYGGLVLGRGRTDGAGIHAARIECADDARDILL
jgi:hypothetical protein